jgi:hypothetical protein
VEDETRRIRWAEHGAQMGNMRNAYKRLTGYHNKNNTWIGGVTVRWEGNIKIGFE